MSRDVTLLHPRLQEKVALLKKKFPKLGISETFRTVAEQNALYAQGRTKPGKIVTYVKGSTYSSQHQWGVAVDYFHNVSGNLYPSAFMKEVAAYAKKIGLAWGGDWKSFKDTPHLYLPDWGSDTAKLKRQYGTPDKFKKTWKKTGATVSKPAATKPEETKPSAAALGAMYYKKFSNKSIVDGLKSINVDSGLVNRKKIAAANGIRNYTGTAAQNTKLLELAKDGKLKKA